MNRDQGFKKKVLIINFILGVAELVIIHNKV